MRNLMNLMSSLVTKHFAGIVRDSYPTNWDSYDEFIEDCSNNGFKRLGSGYFSVAFAHESCSDKILKVGLKKEDSAAAYIGFCRMNAGMKGIPVIHDVERYQDCYIAILDWYTKFEYVSGHSLYNLLFNVANAAVTRGVDAHDEYFDSISAQLAVDAHKRVSEVPPEFILDQVRPIIETGLMIHKFFRGIASFDLHADNVMLTSTGELIITDPVSFSADRESDAWGNIEPSNCLALKEAALIEKCRNRHERKLNKQWRRKEAAKAGKRRRLRKKQMAKIKIKPEAMKLRWPSMYGHVVQTPAPMRTLPSKLFASMKPRKLIDSAFIKCMIKPSKMIDNPFIKHMTMPPEIIKQRVAVAAQRPLPIDDYLQNRLMG